MRRGAASGIAGRGCKQVQYVPVETVRLDSIYLTHILRDSIVRYDDVAVFPSCRTTILSFCWNGYDISLSLSYQWCETAVSDGGIT